MEFMNDHLKDLIMKYLSGTLSISEKDEFERLRTDNPNMETWIDEMRRTWKGENEIVGDKIEAHDRVNVNDEKDFYEPSPQRKSPVPLAVGLLSLGILGLLLANLLSKNRPYQEKRLYVEEPMERAIDKSEEKIEDLEGVFQRKVLIPLKEEFTKDELKEGMTLKIEGLKFEANSDSLTEDSWKSVKELESFLKKHKDIEVEISGHTDNTGSTNDNLALSQKRANALRKILKQKDIDVTRIKAKGYGETKPISTNATEEGKAENRRTEITILKIK